jgi:hypothetical protein
LSEEFQSVINRHKWTFDRLVDLENSNDKNHPEYDASSEARFASRNAEQEEAALTAVCCFDARTRTARRRKAEYLSLKHAFEGLQSEHFAALLTSELH